MDDEDDTTGPTTPSLDYYTPPASRPRDLAVVRFTAGAGLCGLALFAAGIWEGDDMAGCSAIGLLIEVALVGGIFLVGRRACRWQRGRPLVERNRAATCAGGVATIGFCLGLIVLSDRIGPAVPDGAKGPAALVLSFLAVAAGPWWVYRPAAGPN